VEGRVDRQRFLDCNTRDDSPDVSVIVCTRNTGVTAAQGEIVTCLDDDAIADETWLGALTRVYDDPDVIGAGGVPRPRWEGGTAPRWLPREFYWTIGCSYRGLPTQSAPIGDPIGANMSFRRAVFDRTSGFTSGIGRVGRTPLGCEAGGVVTLPTGVVHGLSDGVRGDHTRYVRAGAIIGGFLVTAAGYLRGRLTNGTMRSAPWKAAS